ncbi:MAG: hypothetical protein AAGI53_00920 [Planctomycetota bacterium]
MAESAWAYIAPESVESEPGATLIIDRMQQAMTLRVPLVVDFGLAGNWFEGK